MQVLLDTSKLQYNRQAVKEIERVANHHGNAAYNKHNLNKEAYFQQETRELVAIMRKHVARVVVSKIYDRGMKEFAYLDKNNNLVALLHDVTPLEGFTAEA